MTFLWDIYPGVMILSAMFCCFVIWQMYKLTKEDYKEDK